MIANLKIYSKHVLAYLGDAAHRRFVATIVALVATHLVGKAVDAGSVTEGLEFLIGGLGGAWSSRTPDIDDSSDEAGA